MDNQGGVGGGGSQDPQGTPDPTPVTGGDDTGGAPVGGDQAPTDAPAEGGSQAPVETPSEGGSDTGGGDTSGGVGGGTGAPAA